MTVMTKKEILEGNKLIAEFMGWELSTEGKKFKTYLPPYGFVKVHPNHLQFHLSWDWLMLIIEKIATIKLDESILRLSSDTFYPRTFGMLSASGKYMFRFNCSPLFEEDKLIEAAYKAVIDFIKRNNESE